MTQQNTAASEESAASAEEFSEFAGHLREMLSKFTLRQSDIVADVSSTAPVEQVGRDRLS